MAPSPQSAATPRVLLPSRYAERYTRDKRASVRKARPQETSLYSYPSTKNTPSGTATTGRTAPHFQPQPAIVTPSAETSAIIAPKIRPAPISPPAPVGAAVMDSGFKPNGYIEVGGNFHVLNNGFGNWYGQYVKGEVQADRKNLWSAELLNQHEFGSTGIYGNIVNTHIFNDDWYSSVIIGGGASASFLPRYRADAFLNRKWLDRRQLITTIGVGANRFPDSHKDASLFLGATYYFNAPWNVQAGIRINNSSPGSVRSTSQFVAVSRGEYGRHFLTMRYGFGREAYQIIGPGTVISDFSSQQISLELRQWVGRDWGINTRGEYYHNPNYNRTGVNLGVFKEF